MPALGQLKYELIFRHTHPPPRKCLFFQCVFGSERDAKLSYLMNLQSKLKRLTVISTVNKNPRKTRLFGEKERFLGGFELKKQPSASGNPGCTNSRARL
jgi:hypothetical protein